MEITQIFRHVDHTLLKATAAWPEIETLCEQAIRMNAASVCVPPCYVKRIHAQYGEQLNICTVIGFPLGYSTTESKCAEARQAIAEGAGEVDMVVNLGDVKSGNFDAVTAEIAALREAAAGKILKVIIETCYLDEREKIELCRCVTQAGADYIKTSTGFGTGGATIEDAKLLVAGVGSGVKVKASGGIRTRQDMEAYLAAGCDRLGTSSAAALLEE